MSQAPFVMSKYTNLNDLLADSSRYHEAECQRLHTALEHAHTGFDMAYRALENKCYDEAILYCGVHSARIQKVLLPVE